MVGHHRSCIDVGARKIDEFGQQKSLPCPLDKRDSVGSNVVASSLNPSLPRSAAGQQVIMQFILVFLLLFSIGLSTSTRLGPLPAVVDQFVETTNLWVGLSEQGKLAGARNVFYGEPSAKTWHDFLKEHGGGIVRYL